MAHTTQCTIKQSEKIKVGRILKSIQLTKYLNAKIQDKLWSSDPLER
jgi:hypothetical protein